MRVAESPTKRAQGSTVSFKRNHLGVTVILPAEIFGQLKAQALKNCRSLTAECRFRIEQSLRAEGVKA